MQRSPCPRSAEVRATVVDRRRETGRRGEQLAAERLRRDGCVELARNVRTREGEIDLIVLDGRVLVFVEVNTRCVSRRSRPIHEDQNPLLGIDGRQRRRIRRLAAAWLREERRRPSADAVRFDAIGVVIDSAGAHRRIEHVQDAF